VGLVRPYSLVDRSVTTTTFLECFFGVNYWKMLVLFTQIEIFTEVLELVVLKG